MNPDDQLLDTAWDEDDIFAEPDDAEADAETDGWFADREYE